MGNESSLIREENFRVAIRNQDVRTVRKMLQWQKNFKMSSILESNTLSPALHLACEVGNLEICNLILRAFPDRITSTNVYGQTPLMHAVTFGHLEIVHRLTSESADILARCVDGQTVFHYAAIRGTDRHLAILKYLTRINRSGLHQLDDTCNPITRMGTPLHIFAAAGNYEGVKFVLQSGLDSLNAQDPKGEPDSNSRSLPVTIAAGHGHRKVARLLRAVGAKSDPAMPFLLDSIATILQEPISEEEILELRYQVYFQSSLVERLLETLF